jgi:hypothetical protein
VGTSLLHSVVAALVPSASAKLSSWATIEAAWLGAGLVAVSGYGGDAATGKGEAAGVRIIDTRDWSACILDQGATRIAFTAGTLLAWGGGHFGEHGGVGLAGYDLARGRRWHLFGRQSLDVQVAGPYAYAVNSWNGWDVSTVEVSTGHVIAQRDRRPPTVLPTGSFLQSWRSRELGVFCGPSREACDHRHRSHRARPTSRPTLRSGRTEGEMTSMARGIPGYRIHRLPYYDDATMDLEDCDPVQAQ